MSWMLLMGLAVRAPADPLTSRYCRKWYKNFAFVILLLVILIVNYVLSTPILSTVKREKKFPMFLHDHTIVFSETHAVCSR